MSAPVTDLAQLRAEYKRATLDERDVAPDPVGQFARWFDEAVAAALPEPNAMTLATVDAAGRPSARIVLLKALDARGFVFFTNYDSRKGRELAGDPRVALLFFWPELERQVRIEGDAPARRARAESDAYFAARPRASRHRRVGVAAERADPGSRVARSARSPTAEARFAGGRAAAAALGRLSRRPGPLRVLAGARVAAARPARLVARGARLDDRPPRAMSAGDRRVTRADR